MAVYAAMIEHLDDGFGRIDDAGQLENTWLAFMNDEWWKCRRTCRQPNAHDMLQGNMPEVTPRPPNTFQSIRSDSPNQDFSLSPQALSLRYRIDGVCYARQQCEHHLFASSSGR